MDVLAFLSICCTVGCYTAKLYDIETRESYISYTLQPLIHPNTIFTLVRLAEWHVTTACQWHPSATMAMKTRSKFSSAAKTWILDLFIEESEAGGQMHPPPPIFETGICAQLLWKLIIRSTDCEENILAADQNHQQHWSQLPTWPITPPPLPPLNSGETTLKTHPIG